MNMSDNNGYLSNETYNILLCILKCTKHSDNRHHSNKKIVMSCYFILRLQGLFKCQILIIIMQIQDTCLWSGVNKYIKT